MLRRRRPVTDSGPVLVYRRQEVTTMGRTAVAFWDQMAMMQQIGAFQPAAMPVPEP